MSGKVILRLPVQARNLAAVLTSLELSGWKSRIAKPLNGRPDGANRHHLGMAAYSLNRRQSRIAFHADGDGIRWNWRTATTSSADAGQAAHPKIRSKKSKPPP